MSLRPSLDPDALIASAIEAAGSKDFGPDRGWRERLAVLTNALEREARLTPLGRTIAHGQLLAALTGRLRARALWRERPEIARIPLPRPIVVLGQMRSGTTRMQRLLACDRRFTFTRFFESWCPVPSRGWFDDRRLRAGAALATARWLNPRFAAIHPTSTGAPDEEFGLHNLSIYGATFEAQWRVPSFAAHCEATDPAPVYAELRKLLQTLAWLRGEREPHSWVLKLPQFMADLPALLAVFPDARLVCLSRDPAAVVASSCSLVRNQMEMQSDCVDPIWIGREWLRKTMLRERRAGEARRRADVAQVEVDYRAIDADWRGEMRRVYAGLGETLTAQVEARMARFLARSRQRAGGHRYGLEEFGLSDGEVRRAFEEAGPSSKLR